MSILKGRIYPVSLHEIAHRRPSGRHVPPYRAVDRMPWLARQRARMHCWKHGHCWHPDSFADWWCCLCPGGTGGMPDQRCLFCRTVPNGT